MSVYENEYRVERVPVHRPPGEGKKWVVSANGTYVRGFSTKKPAVKKAKDLARKNRPSNVVVEYEGGGIVNKLEYD